MATGLTGIAGLLNTSSLITSTFGQNNGLLGLLNTSGSKGLSSLSSLTSTSALNATALSNQQALNRTELALGTSAKSLNSADAASVFNTVGVKSSKPAAVTATTLPNAKAGTFSVGVTQLAQAQKTSGTALAGGAASGIATGANGYGQLAVNVNGQQQLVTYQLAGGETNTQALGKIASAVNGRNLGVTANVTTDAAGNSKLNLTGATGATNGFTVTDTVGNAAATAGVNNPANVTQTAQNANFSVNGTNYSTSTNTPTVGTSGLNLQLNQTTGATNATVTGNSADVEKSVRGFVAQYNDTLSQLKANPTTISMQSASNLQGAVTQNSGNLAAVGITAGANGQLSINEAKFQSSLATNPAAVQSAFNKGGLASGVDAETSRAISQSLATPVSGGFTSLSGSNNSLYGGLSTNQFIASNIGLFMNSFM